MSGFRLAGLVATLALCGCSLISGGSKPGAPSSLSSIGEPSKESRDAIGWGLTYCKDALN